MPLKEYTFNDHSVMGTADPLPNLSRMYRDWDKKRQSSTSGRSMTATTVTETVCTGHEVSRTSEEWKTFIWNKLRNKSWNETTKLDAKEHSHKTKKIGIKTFPLADVCLWWTRVRHNIVSANLVQLDICRSRSICSSWSNSSTLVCRSFVWLSIMSSYTLISFLRACTRSSIDWIWLLLMLYYILYQLKIIHSISKPNVFLNAND